MTVRSELEPSEAQCNSIADYVALAQRALAAPRDEAYAKYLLQQAEAQCQMPLDYLQPAGVAGSDLGDVDYARELYDQAEEMLFDASEHLAFARSIGLSMGDREKAAEHLRIADEEASSAAEWLAIANLARECLNDTSWAYSLIAKVNAQIQNMDAALQLVQTLIAADDTLSARAVFDQAARYCDDVTATVSYAGQLQHLFGDANGVRAVLDAAQMDCQFTADYIALATGYQNLLHDLKTRDELMEQAREFCMSAQEQLDLANGLWSLLKDPQAAADAYAQALVEINDNQTLLLIANTIASELHNSEVAKQYYARAEQRMSAASDRLELAQAIIANLGDHDYAAAVYDRALEKLFNANDLAKLGSQLLHTLADRERAYAAYSKACDRANDVNALMRLLTPVAEELTDPVLLNHILDKAMGVASGTQELLIVATHAHRFPGGETLAKQALIAAEDHVSSIGEIRSVHDQIGLLFAHEDAWRARVADLLARREANQGRYDALRLREQTASGVVDFIALADTVIAELDDRAYATKLLTYAQQQWADTGYVLASGRELILAVAEHIDDTTWCEQLVELALQHCQRFVSVQFLANTVAHELGNKHSGLKLARRIYEHWEQRLADQNDRQAYALNKLARAVMRDLSDGAWAQQLLDRAAEMDLSALVAAELALTAGAIGAPNLTAQLEIRAQERCSSPHELIRVLEHLANGGVPSAHCRQLYANAGDNYTDVAMKWDWVKGIVSLFGDREWAHDEYRQLKTRLTDNHRRYDASAGLFFNPLLY